jgi:glutamate dehydrogenase (NAD(P)+)
VDDPNEMLAVVQDGRLVGVVTDWDITSAIAEGKPDHLPVSEVMSREVITVPPTASIPEVLELLETHEITAMPVVEDGDVAGVISSHILARKTLARLLQG